MLEMMTSLDLPERRDLRTVLYPRVYLPDLRNGRVGRRKRRQRRVSVVDGWARRGDRREERWRKSGGSATHLMTI